VTAEVGESVLQQPLKTLELCLWAV